MQKNSKDKIKTFTIGFADKKHNEAEYAKNIANFLGCDHTEEYISENEMIDIIHDFPNYFDEPMSDAAAIPTLLLAQLAHQKVKVILTGDGGDEFFCGYDQYQTAKLYKKVDRFRTFLPSKQFLYHRDGKLSNILYGIIANDNKQCKTQWVCRVDQKIVNSMLLQEVDSELRFLIEDKFHTNNWVRKRMLVDAKTTLVDGFLVKTDRATMAHSLEARCPLLDGEVIQRSYQLPLSYLEKQGNRKRILKDILADYIPRELFERPKHGFSVPIDQWLRGTLHKQLTGFIDGNKLMRQGLFRADYMEWMLEEFNRGNKYMVRYLWNFYIFQLWYQTYIEDLWLEE